MARLIFNGGSSSWKSGVYEVAADAQAASPAEPLVEVRLSWASESDAAHVETDAGGAEPVQHEARVPHDSAVPHILETLAAAGCVLEELESVGHRIVHGADLFTRTTWLDDGVIARLRELEPFAPSHNALELAAVAAVHERLPEVPQYAVFDTQYHTTLPQAAAVYAGPYDWLPQRIRRYGFHGSSIAYAVERVLAMMERPAHATGIIVAHLGGGCSVTAVQDGASVATSMGFTPLEGTMMATRSGSVDPAILIYLMREAARAGRDLAGTAAELDTMLNKHSGLAGLSGISGDVREVEQASLSGNARATLALDVFVHRLAATIGEVWPSLDRCDALVFTGGIGEHAADIRARVAARLGFAGVALDAGANAARPQDAEISAAAALVRTFVLTAREDWYVAREGARLARVGKPPA